jgi:cytoskeletal protein CcmA (bactofilin family)
VHANIDAQLVVIEGSIEGDVRAEKSVAVSATAQVTGNITAPAVAILQGATFNGTIDMSGNKAASADVTASQVLRRSTSGA